jgi:hypothetical protein
LSTKNKGKQTMQTAIRRAVGSALLLVLAVAGAARADVKNLSVGINGATCPT